MINKIEKVIFFLTIFFLPIQLGKHFWPDFSFVDGIRVDYLSPTIYLTDIFILNLFCLYFFGIIRNWSRKIQNSKFRIQNYNSKFKILNFKFNFSLSTLSFKLIVMRYLYFVILCFVLIISSILARQSLASFYGLLKIVEFAFLAFYIVKKMPEFGIEKLIKTLSFSAFIFSIIGIMQFVKQGSLGGIFYYLGERTFSSSTIGIANMNVGGELILRPYSTFAHPNVFAFYLLFVNILVLSYILDKKIITKNILFIMFLIMSSLALFLTFSRVIILLYIIFLFYIFLRHKILTRRIFLVLFVPIALLFLYFSKFYPRFIDFQFLLRDYSFRSDLIDISFKILRESPIWGIGLKNFFYYESIYQRTVSPVFLQPVHNVFVLVLVETGIVGLLLFAELLRRTFIRLLENIKISKKNEHRNFHKFLLFLFISFLIVSIFDHFFITLHQGLFIASLMFGIIYSKAS